ncbi:MAG: hypothetical protein ABIQ57_15465 [Candidatus Kapaibacterium sp.]
MKANAVDDVLQQLDRISLHITGGAGYPVTHGDDTRHREAPKASAPSHQSS